MIVDKTQTTAKLKPETTSLKLNYTNLKNSRRQTALGISSRKQNEHVLTPRKGHSLPKLEVRLMKLQHNGISTYEKNARKYIYGGTKEKIVLKILRWLVTEPNRNDIFHLVSVLINGFRLYVTSSELFKTLVSFWDKPTSRSARSSRLDMTRSAIMLFMTLWWEQSIEEDFINGIEGELVEWMENLPESYKLPLLAKYEKTKLEKTKTILFEKLAPSNDIYQSIMDIPDDVIALHLTFLDIEAFMKISINEFFEIKRTQLEEVVEKSAILTRSLVGFVLERKNLKERCKAIKKILKIAVALENLHNYNALMACWGAINSHYVTRLTKTKKRLSKSTLDLWSHFEELLDGTQNFSSVRNVMSKRRKEHLPLVPWIELLVKGRNHVEEYPSVFYLGNDQVLYDGLPIINFAKLEHLNEVISEFIECKKNNKYFNQIWEGSLNFSVNNIIQSLQTYTDTELWELSHLCEKKGNKNI